MSHANDGRILPGRSLYDEDVDDEDEEELEPMARIW